MTPTPHRQVPEALRIADEFKLCSEYDSKPSIIDIEKAEAELRRLHAENTALQQGYDAARMEIDGLRDRVQELGAMLRENCNRRIVELEAQLESIGAGGVEPLRRRECMHQIAEPAPAREYPALPDPDASTVGHGHMWNRHSMRAYVDADRAMRAHAAPAAVAGPSDSEIDALVASIGPTEGMRRDSRDLTMDKLRVLVRRALATWGHIKAAPWEQNESAYQRGYMDGMAKGRRDVDAAPQQEAQEPVAWQGVHDQTDLYYTKPAQADVRPLYTTTQTAPAAQGDALSWLQANDMAALERFAETTDDDESYDIGKDAVQRLAGFGCLRSHGFGKYSITDFGHYVLNDWSLARELPFKSQSERDAARKQGANHD